MSWPFVTIDRSLQQRPKLLTAPITFSIALLVLFLLLISFAILIKSSFASPILLPSNKNPIMKNSDTLLKIHHHTSSQSGRLLRRVARTASAQEHQQLSVSSTTQACLVQLVERRSCRPMSAPVDWDVDLIDDSSATVEPSDTAEFRYHEMGYNAPSLRLTPYNEDPHDESTYFIERPVNGKPGLFTLQTLSTREFVCVSRRGRLRLQQAPSAKRRCWWVAGKMTFGTYGQQRHSIALISARHYPKIGHVNITQINNNNKVIKLPNVVSLADQWVVGFRRDGRPLPTYAPKVITHSHLLQNAGTNNIAFDTFLFTRLVASHDVHEAHGFNSNSCSESMQRHNNYARHLVFC